MSEEENDKFQLTLRDLNGQHRVYKLGMKSARKLFKGVSAYVQKREPFTALIGVVAISDNFDGYVTLSFVDKYGAEIRVEMEGVEASLFAEFLGFKSKSTVSSAVLRSEDSKVMESMEPMKRYESRFRSMQNELDRAYRESAGLARQARRRVLRFTSTEKGAKLAARFTALRAGVPKGTDPGDVSRAIAKSLSELEQTVRNSSTEELAEATGISADKLHEEAPGVFRVLGESAMETLRRLNDAIKGEEFDN